MTITTTLFLAGLLILLAALPSASVALVATRAATRGLPDGIAVAGGIVCGDLAFVLLSLLGMSFVAELLGPLFVIIKFLASGYLIYLGLSLLRGPRACTVDAPVVRGSSLMLSFASGFLLTLGDLKALFFYASLFPVVIDLSKTGLLEIFLILFLTVFCVGGVKAAYAVVAHRAGRRPFGRRFSPLIRRTAGGLLIGSGIYLAAKP